MYRVPRATYRLQLNAAFTFNDAKRIAPYLSELGISDLYLSPILKARKGSAHGYDVVDASFYIFERAAYLLRLLLPAALSRDGVTKEVFDAALQQCVDSGRY